MAHTNTCPAYAEAVIALRGLDSRRSGWTETDDEWAALEQLLAGRALRPVVTEHLTHPRTLREYAKRVSYTGPCQGTAYGSDDDIYAPQLTLGCSVAYCYKACYNTI